MGYAIDYGKLESCATRRERDERAVADLMEWFEDRPGGINQLMLAATVAEELATGAKTDTKKLAEVVESLWIAFGFGGVSGYPVQAFLRKHCLTAYRIWLAEDNILTDAEGFSYEPARALASMDNSDNPTPEAKDMN